MTAAINNKIEQVEHLVLSRLNDPSPQASVPPVPPIPQSYGGPRASTTGAQHFNVGSPLSAPPGFVPENSGVTPDPWSRMPTYPPGPPSASAGPQNQFGAGPQNQAPAPTYASAGPQNQFNAGPQNQAPANLVNKYWDEKHWSVTHAKISKELKPFAGVDSTYRTWAGRVKDHFKEVNADWSLVFAEIERQKTYIPLSSQNMSYLYTQEKSIQVDFRYVSMALWTFMGKNISDVLYGNRSAMASGPDNGIELWRAYFVKHEGGADQVELGGIGSLHTFPQCTKIEDLGFWLGKWMEVKDTYGQGMSDIHLRSMFLNILPENVKKEVRETKGLTTLHDMILYVQSDLGRLNDLKLSKLHTDRLKQTLGAAHRVNVLTEQEEPIKEAPNPHDQYQSLINALSSKIDTIAAAVSTTRGQAGNPRGGQRPQQRQGQREPSDYAKFKGCLHCGGDHRVADCRIKKALLAKNGGKLPSGFKSAFEKWKTTQPKKVAALSDAELVDDDDESESDMVWGVSCKAIHAQPLRPPCDYLHHNSFAEIFDDNDYDDEDDDDEHMLNALRNIASSVKVGPKVSQKKRNNVGRTKPMDKRTIASIAKQVRDGHYNLPDLQLETNNEFEAVWALVDSGAGRSCAKRKEHFPNTRTDLKSSSVRMATASGQELKSRGCFKLNLLSSEGNPLTQTFEDADVDMPIMSVTELASNGSLGSDVVFRKHDGAIVDVETNATSKFVRRKGVYFMKIFTPKNNKSGFTRPGAA